MRVLVYDRAANVVRVFNRNRSDSMPYVQNRFLTVDEFLGSSNSNLVWTSREQMENYSKLRAKWGKPIPIRYAFKRIWEGGHSAQSQHYAGTAIDMGQGMPKSERDALRRLAIKMGIFSYVEPASLTPTWVHIDSRYGTPACGAGYPVLSSGSRGNYVFVLQDALTNLGYTSVQNIDGVMGARTVGALRNFQRNHGLAVTGTTNCETWRALTGEALENGPTNSTIDR